MKDTDYIKILVIGSSGMLGNALLRFFTGSPGFSAKGTVRSEAAADLLPEILKSQVFSGVDVENIDALADLFDSFQPDIAINCVGVVKQLTSSQDPLVALPINSLFPHRLARICALVNCRLLHLSTDCVFTGCAGMYRESDPPDARDLYGLSKYLGEVDYPHAMTLRTSIIGHELSGGLSLVDWFLSQEQSVSGYKRAVFSGLPTVEIARIIRDYVLPNPSLTGVYHVSAEPIDKYELLSLVAKVYGKEIEIIQDDDFIIDRSLDSSRFRTATGFMPSSWPDLIRSMKNFG